MFNADKTFKTLDELTSSPEFQELFQSYSPSEKKRKIRVMKRSQFIIGYVVKNGKQTEIFHHFISPDGIKMLKKVDPLSELNNKHFTKVIPKEDGFRLTHEKFGRSEEDRKRIREYDITVTTEL